jgi:phytoene dehydrogenase-like protein
VRVNARVATIRLRDGRASGVVLASGEEIEARRVVSGASPRATFLELCDPALLDPELVRAIRNIRHRGVVACVHLALDSLPRWRGDAGEAAHPPGAVVIAPDIDYVERAYDDAKYGRVAERPWLDVSIPTIADPGFAPNGRHVMSIHVQYAPYMLREAAPAWPDHAPGRAGLGPAEPERAGPGPAGVGDPRGPGIRAWDAASRDVLADHVIRILAEYAPELPGLVRHRHALTPKDLETQFSLPEGHAYHGELALDQAFFMRPVPDCSRHRTPVGGLYLCGSGAHPGGGVPGQAGANAAAQIVRDAGRGGASH